MVASRGTFAIFSADIHALNSSNSLTELVRILPSSPESRFKEVHLDLCVVLYLFRRKQTMLYDLCVHPLAP